MIGNDDLNYWRARVMQEQQAAQKASCSTARLIHDQLAVMCRFKASMLSRPLEDWSEREPVETGRLFS